MTSMIAIPRINANVVVREGEAITTNGFTIGKEYPIMAKVGVVGEERLGRVINDNGHERLVFLDGSPCAHIMLHRKHRQIRSISVQDVAGHFDIVTKS